MAEGCWLLTLAISETLSGGNKYVITGLVLKGRTFDCDNFYSIELKQEYMTSTDGKSIYWDIGRVIGVSSEQYNKLISGTYNPLEDGWPQLRERGQPKKQDIRKYLEANIKKDPMNDCNSKVAYWIRKVQYIDSIYEGDNQRQMMKLELLEPTGNGNYRALNTEIRNKDYRWVRFWRYWSENDPGTLEKKYYYYKDFFNKSKENLYVILSNTTSEKLYVENQTTGKKLSSAWICGMHWLK